MLANNSQMKDFCDKVQLYPDTRPKLSEQQIINEIRAGAIFGMAEVDIHCPDHLKESFSEFQPITKKAMLSRQDIGPMMKSFAEEHNLLKKPSSVLLSSYFGKKMLMATPLLKWLLNHGIECTAVHTLIQYTPSKCFAKFGEAVVNARREGDADPSKKIIGDMCKLLGKQKYYLSPGSFNFIRWSCVLASQ